MFKKCSLEVSLNCTFSNFSLLMYVPLKASRVVVSYTVASYGKKPQDALSIVLSSSRSLKSDFNANAPDVCCLFVQLFFNKWPSSRHWHSHFTFHTGSFSTSFFFGPKKKWVIHSRVHNKGNSTTVYILLLNSMRSMVMVYIRINITFRPFWKVRKFSIYRAWLYFYSLMAKAVLMHPNNNDSGSSDKKKHHRRIM